MRPSFGSILVPLFDQTAFDSVSSPCAPGFPSGLVKLCEDADLVVRERDRHDGRAFRIRLSARGRELRVVAERELRSLDAELVAALGKTNHAALRRALKGVVDL